MRFKAVIFDLDGTLVHTTPEYRYKIVRQVLNDFDMKVQNNFIDRFWFESRRKQIIKEHFKLEPELFWKAYAKYEDLDFRRACISAYHDIDFISELRDNGFRTGIVTGAPQFIAEMEIGLIGRHNFDSVIFQDILKNKPKPHPDGIHECLKLLGLTERETVFVGNSDEDMLAAQNAKMLDVMIDRKEHEFPHVTPSLTISSLYELRPLLGIK